MDTFRSCGNPVTKLHFLKTPKSVHRTATVCSFGKCPQNCSFDARKKVRIELQTMAVLWTLFKTAIYGRFAQVIWKGSTSIFFNVFKVDNCGQNSFTSTLTESNLAQKCLFCKSFGSSITKNLIYITYIILQSTLQHKSLFPAPLHNMIAAKSALIQFLISCIQENYGNKGEM